jgi:hypothetical protein
MSKRIKLLLFTVGVALGVLLGIATFVWQPVTP